MNPLVATLIGLGAGAQIGGPAMAVRPSSAERPGIDKHFEWAVLAEWHGGFKLVRPLTRGWGIPSILEGRSPGVPTASAMWWGELPDRPSVTLYLVHLDRVRAALTLADPAGDLSWHLQLRKGAEHLSPDERGVLLWMLVDVLDAVDPALLKASRWKHTLTPELLRLRVPATVRGHLLDSFITMRLHSELERAIDQWEKASRAERAATRAGQDLWELEGSTARARGRALRLEDKILSHLNREYLGHSTGKDRRTKQGVFIHGSHRPIEARVGVDHQYPYTAVWWLRERGVKGGPWTGIRPVDQLPDLQSDNGSLLDLLAANDLLIATEAFDDWLEANIIEPVTVYVDLSDAYGLLGESYPFLWPNNRYFAYIGWRGEG